jgi:hypothetical protein
VTKETSPRTHVTKSWTKYFKGLAESAKGVCHFTGNAALKPFRVGDMLYLHEWDDSRKKYTGNTSYHRVDEISRDTRDNSVTLKVSK